MFIVEFNNQWLFVHLFNNYLVRRFIEPDQTCELSSYQTDAHLAI